MNSSDPDDLSTNATAAGNKRLVAVAGISLIAVILLWLNFRACDDARMDKWAKAMPGPYRLELLPGLTDTLMLSKSRHGAPADDSLVIALNEKRMAFPFPMAQVMNLPVEVVVGGFPEKPFSGRVDYYVSVVKSGKAGVDSTIHLVVKVGDPEKLLRQGMTVYSSVLVDTSSRAPFVPDSIVFETDSGAVIFPRSMWPRARRVALGPSEKNNIMILDGIDAGEEVASFPPSNVQAAKRLGQVAYRKAVLLSREAALQEFAGRLRAMAAKSSSDSLAAGAESGIASNRQSQVNSAPADCTAAIDQMLSEVDGDSSKSTVAGKIRIGPGEGGKLAPVAPEAVQQLKPGEKISVSVPAASDTSADTLNTKSRQVEPDSSGSSGQPPGA